MNNRDYLKKVYDSSFKKELKKIAQDYDEFGNPLEDFEEEEQSFEEGAAVFQPQDQMVMRDSSEENPVLTSLRNALIARQQALESQNLAQPDSNLLSELISYNAAEE